jgi:hypothetical protein
MYYTGILLEALKLTAKIPGVPDEIRTDHLLPNIS